LNQYNDFCIIFVDHGWKIIVLFGGTFKTQIVEVVEVKGKIPPEDLFGIKLHTGVSYFRIHLNTEKQNLHWTFAQTLERCFFLVHRLPI
jgi:hypothetical protein